MCCSRYFVTIGAVLAGIAVGTGAFAAHGLEDYFSSMYADQTREVAGQTVPAMTKYLGDFKTAAEYQMYHSLALIALGLLIQAKPCRTLTAAGVCFLIGILLFSGCLYIYTLTAVRWLVIPIPIGGTFFIIGWFLAAWGACPSAKTEPCPR